MGVSSFQLSSVKTGKKYRNFAIPLADYPFSTSGGDEVTTISGTKYHVFTTSGTFTITGASKSFEILCVGGGGGGGKYCAGGGGGGEVDLFAAQTLTAGSYTVTVGAQGNGATDQNNKGASGGQSQFIGVSTITSLGGGGGGSRSNSNGANGGSGGGGGRYKGTGGTASGSNTKNGGSSILTGGGSLAGGGGGGATADGQGAAANTLGGAGGAGYALSTADANLTSANFTSLTGMTHLSAGGGGGGYFTGAGGAGGSSGQAGAGSANDSAGGNATSFGSGGGGGGFQSSGGNGGNGKGGVVIVKYVV